MLHRSAFYVESNFPKEYKTHNLFQIDSLNGKKSVKNIKKTISGLNGDERKIIVIETHHMWKLSYEIKITRISILVNQET